MHAPGSPWYGRDTNCIGTAASSIRVPYYSAAAMMALVVAAVARRRGYITVQIRSSLTFPVTWAPVANMAPTIFLRLRQYVHHMYLGGHTKAQGKQMFGCRTVAAELPEILPE